MIENRKPETAHEIQPTKYTKRHEKEKEQVKVKSQKSKVKSKLAEKGIWYRIKTSPAWLTISGFAV